MDYDKREFHHIFPGGNIISPSKGSPESPACRKIVPFTASCLLFKAMFA